MLWLISDKKDIAGHYRNQNQKRLGSRLIEITAHIQLRNLLFDSSPQIK
jgi:hypothetical protein